MRFALATIAAVLLVIACPGAADASASVRFGIQDDAWLAFGPGTLDSRLKTLDQLGVKLVRYTIRWDEVAPTRPDQPKWSGDPAYRWGSSDAVLKALRAHGIDVVLEMRFTPGWANGDTGRNGIPTDGDDFANFATAVQNRFPWIRDYLIWNEPNKPLFLKPLSAEQYVKKILNPAYAALHAVSKSVRVAGGITGPRAGPGGVSPIDWIHQMKAAGARLDVYAHNPYPEQPQRETPTSGACKKCPSITMASLEKLQVEVQKAWPGKHMWLTEYGYQTNPPDKKLGVSYALQAQVHRRGCAACLSRGARRHAHPLHRPRRAQPRRLAERLHDHEAERRSRRTTRTASRSTGRVAKGHDGRLCGARSGPAAGSGRTGSRASAAAAGVRSAAPRRRTRVGLLHAHRDAREEGARPRLLVRDRGVQPSAPAELTPAGVDSRRARSS